MPTGILRDIWIALSSLGDHQQPKLTKLWVRFHDNHAALRDAGLLQPTSNAQSAQEVPGTAISLPPNQQPPPTEPEHYGVKKIIRMDHHIEGPNFSIMPPLSSMTVLNIDETRYLDELTVLLARSLSTLRELRIGMATTLNIPPSAEHSPNLAPLFSGGVFSLLISKIYRHNVALGLSDSDPSRCTNLRPEIPTVEEIKVEGAKTDNLSTPSPMEDAQSTDVVNAIPCDPATEDSGSRLSALAAQVANVALDAIDPALTRQNSPLPCSTSIPSQVSEESLEGDEANKPTSPAANSHSFVGSSNMIGPTGPSHASQKLRLEVLEIERITMLSPSILCKTVDFTLLTSLTLLQCGDQSSLWGRLRKEFAPRITRGTVQSSKASVQSHHTRQKATSELPASDVEYQLKLKRIHTDAVSSDLISFLKNTLAPNSLEWLFLQDTELFPSPVSLETIYRGPIRRHRSSLTKVMIDSAYGPLATRSRTNAARKWMLNRDILTFITSGKMCKLRELGVALEYKDWHFFLQRLPNIPHLRSLYVPNMSDHPYGNSLNIKDLALGTIDVVALRPEVELCYLGIKNKCFEILERKQKDKPKKGQGPPSASPAADTASDDDTHDADNHDDDDDSDDDTAAAPPPPAIDPGAMDSDTGSITSEDEDEKADAAGGKNKVRLKLREILFYDDKVSIFKARHGRL